MSQQESCHIHGTCHKMSHVPSFVGHVALYEACDVHGSCHNVMFTRHVTTSRSRVMSQDESCPIHGSCPIYGSCSDITTWAYMYIRMYVCIYIHTNVYMHIDMKMYMYTYIYIYMYMYIHIYIRICIYVYIQYIYTCDAYFILRAMRAWLATHNTTPRKQKKCIYMYITCVYLNHIGNTLQPCGQCSQHTTPHPIQKTCMCIYHIYAIIYTHKCNMYVIPLAMRAMLATHHTTKGSSTHTHPTAPPSSCIAINTKNRHRNVFQSIP